MTPAAERIRQLFHKRFGPLPLVGVVTTGVLFILAILSLAVEPLEVDFLHVYPQVEGVEYGDEGFTVSLQLPEAIQ